MHYCCLGYRWHNYKLNKLKTTSGTVLQFTMYILYSTVTRFLSPHGLSLSLSLCLYLTLVYNSLPSRPLRQSVISDPPSLPYHFFQPLFGSISLPRFRLSVTLPLLSYFAPYFTWRYLTRSYYPSSYLSYTISNNSMYATSLVSFPPFTLI